MLRDRIAELAAEPDTETTGRPDRGRQQALVHGYLDLDRRRIVEAIPAAREQYGLYVEQVARWLLDRQKVSGGT
jgi:hypothetical protein